MIDSVFNTGCNDKGNTGAYKSNKNNVVRIGRKSLMSYFLDTAFVGARENVDAILSVH